MNETNPTARAPGLTSLRRQVTGAGIAIAIVILAIAVIVLATLRNETLDDSDRELATVGRITAERTSQTFSATDVLVRSIADLAMKPGPGDTGSFHDRASTREFHDGLLRLQKLLPQVEIAAVADENGDILGSSREYPAPRINTANTGFFLALKEAPEQELFVSAPILARLNGEWLIYLARSLIDGDGKFAGVVLVGISVTYFEGYFSTIDLGPTATISLINDQPALIARWPRADDQIGGVLSGWNPTARPAVGDSIVYLAKGKGGDLQHVAVTRLQVQDTPLYLAVSRTQQAALQPWRDVLAWIVLLAVISIVVLSVLTWFILRAVRDEERWNGTLLDRETQLSRQAVELAAARDLAETANRARGEFLANMSHELRTPLNAILGFSEILERELFGPLGDARYKEFALDIHGSGKHLLEIIGNILDLAKVDAGKLELYEDDVDVVEMMHICTRLVAEAADNGRVKLDIQAPRDPIYILGDSTRIRQIFLNLLSNAVKFTPEGQQVTLTGQVHEDGFLFRVVDTGIGMTEEEAVQAMQPFRQIDNSLSRRYQGTGLGLPLTKSLVELHGGTMQIESAPGKGTTVTIWLPRRRESDAESAAA